MHVTQHSGREFHLLIILSKDILSNIEHASSFEQPSDTIIIFRKIKSDQSYSHHLQSRKP